MTVLTYEEFKNTHIKITDEAKEDMENFGDSIKEAIEQAIRVEYEEYLVKNS